MTPNQELLMLHHIANAPDASQNIRDIAQAKMEQKYPELEGDEETNVGRMLQGKPGPVMGAGESFATHLVMENPIPYVGPFLKRGIIGGIAGAEKLINGDERPLGEIYKDVGQNYETQIKPGQEEQNPWSSLGGTVAGGMLAPIPGSAMTGLAGAGVRAGAIGAGLTANNLYETRDENNGVGDMVSDAAINTGLGLGGEALMGIAGAIARRTPGVKNLFNAQKQIADIGENTAPLQEDVNKLGAGLVGNRSQGAAYANDLAGRGLTQENIGQFFSRPEMNVGPETTYTDMFGNLKKIKQINVDEINKIYSDASETQAFTPNDLKNAAIKTIYDLQPTAEGGSNLGKVLPEEEIIDHLNDALDFIHETTNNSFKSGGVIPLDQANTLSSLVKRLQPNTMKPGTLGGKQEVNRAFVTNIRDILKSKVSAHNPESLNKLKVLNKDHSIIKQIEPSLKQKASAEGANVLKQEVTPAGMLQASRSILSLDTHKMIQNVGASILTTSAKAAEFGQDPFLQQKAFSAAKGLLSDKQKYDVLLQRAEKYVPGAVRMLQNAYQTSGIQGANAVNFWLQQTNPQWNVIMNKKEGEK